MIINIGDFLITIKPVYIIYPVLFCLIVCTVAAIAGYIWVCLTPGGDPLFTLPQESRRRGYTATAVDIDPA
jgi:hypothetical protein